MKSNEPKKRLKAAESRRALLDAGLELLKSRGVAPGLDRVTLKEAIEVSGVPRSTAYRLYEGGRGQLEEYRADLLIDLDRPLEEGATAAAVVGLLEEGKAIIESQEPVAMAALLREMVRVSVQASIEEMAQSLEWQLYMSALASAAGESDPALMEMFREASKKWGRRHVDLIVSTISSFGLRVRSDIDAETLSLIHI